MAEYTLSEEQREVVQHALGTYEDEVLKARKKVVGVGARTDEMDEILGLLRGDGVERPGLLRIFSNDDDDGQLEMVDQQQLEAEDTNEEADDDTGLPFTAGDLEDASAAQLKEWCEEMECEPESGSGKGGRVVMNDRKAALEALLEDADDTADKEPEEDPDAGAVERLIEENTYEELLEMAGGFDDLSSPEALAVMEALEQLEDTEAEAAETDGEVLPEPDEGEGGSDHEDEDILPFEKPAESDDNEEPASEGSSGVPEGMEEGDVVTNTSNGEEFWIDGFRPDTGDVFLEASEGPLENEVVAKAKIADLRPEEGKDTGYWVVDGVTKLAGKEGASEEAEDEAADGPQEDDGDSEWPPHLQDKPKTQRVCLKCLEDYDEDGTCPDCGEPAPWAESA